MQEMRVVYTDFEIVKTWPRNPKDHDLEEIKKSFHRFGFVQPVLLDENTGQLVAGHGRLETLGLIKKSKGKIPKGIKAEGDKWLVPVLRGVSFKNEKEAEAFLLADNKLTERGGWNQDKLDAILNDLDGDLLEGTGFESTSIKKIIDDAEELTEKKEVIKPYSRVHVLFSIPLDLMPIVTDRIQEIASVEGVEFNTSNN